MSSSRFAIGALILAGSLVASQSASAAQIGFSLTEVSDTLLTSSLPGVSITNVNPDEWEIDLGPAGIIVVGGGGSNMAWVEPDDPLTVNYLSSLGGTRLRLLSDFPLAQLPTGLSCGGTPPPLGSGVTCLVAADGVGNDYFVTVLDEGDDAVPEPATLSLFGLGLAGLAFLNRKRAA
jgi:hypothetical protein